MGCLRLVIIVDQEDDNVRSLILLAVMDQENEEKKRGEKEMERCFHKDQIKGLMTWFN